MKPFDSPSSHPPDSVENASSLTSPSYSHLCVDVSTLLFLSLLALLSPAVTTGLSSTTSNTMKSQVNPARNILSNRSVPGLTKGMDYIQLGSSDLVVSKICMGTMTFGEQNTIQEGVEQLQYAFDQFGLNFIDTAEMYPVPTKPTTQGLTDQTVAQFLQSRPRSSVILATKVSGRSDRITWIRKDGVSTKLTQEQILQSVDSSLKRLGTDYIDLLQLHWPDRYTGGMFGQPDFNPDSYTYEPTPLEEQLSALQQVIREGKVRYVGVSNETPYGLCSMLALAKQFPDLYPRIVSIQNSYSLVVRKDFEAGLAEACFHHNVALLPYSPLAGGVLTGKYSDPEHLPAKARLRMFPGFMDRYLGSQNEAAVNEYVKIAKDIGITPAQLALSWCYHRNLVSSTIIGATTLDQLKENLQAYDVRLDENTMTRINQVYKKYTDPTKA